MKLNLPSQNITIFIVILAIVSLVLWGIALHTQLAVCVSESLKDTTSLFILKGKSFERGDIVLIEEHEVPLAQGKQLAKRIVGLPGDSVLQENKTVRVCSSPLSLLSQTKMGEPLSPLSSKDIPEGMVFVVGDHPRSFDSRYEEFGLVNINHIVGRALWFW